MRLTDRNMGILLALAEGATTGEIGAANGWTTVTAQSYIDQVVRALGARNRTHAVALAYHHGVLIPTRSAA